MGFGVSEDKGMASKIHYCFSSAFTAMESGDGHGKGAQNTQEKNIFLVPFYS